MGWLKKVLTLRTLSVTLIGGVFLILSDAAVLLDSILELEQTRSEVVD
jgi:hypothetical protein